MNQHANEWQSYAARLSWAMRRVGKTNQSQLARAVGIKPQSIQYLCDPLSGAQGSSHTPALARELGVNPDWLARGVGLPTDAGAAVLGAEPSLADYEVEGVPLGSVVGVCQASSPATAQEGGAAAGQQGLALALGQGGGALRLPVRPGEAVALRVKGNALAPYAKDGQYLLLKQDAQDIAPEDHVLITCQDGRVLLREVLVCREDTLVVLPVQGGQPQAIEREAIVRTDLVLCVAPRRWWRAA